jgi:RNA polymerase sigma-70 factor (ECF subfamily)
VLRADHAVVRTGAVAETRGAQAVAAAFSGRARAARLALIDGVAGLVWASGGRPRVVFSFTLTGGKITAIDLLGDPAVLGKLDVAALPG